MATVSDYKSLKCPVCFERYISPRVLPCQHTLCEKCIDAHVTSQVDSGTERLCPLCNSSIVPPGPKLSVDKWTKAFPLHSLICSLLKSSEVSDNREHFCEHCENDGETVNADVWCTDCREQLCHSCDKSHRRSKLRKHHRAVPISEMEQEMESAIQFDQNCDRHGKEIELFCVDHRKLCCSLCIATDHRQCDDVRVIDDMAREQTQRSTSAYPSIVNDIKELKTEMAKIMSSKTKNVTEISQEKQEIIRDVDNRIDKIITELNKLRNEFRKETEHLHKETESSILKNNKIVQSFMINVENAEEISEIVEKKGSSGQKFAIFEHITTEITSHYKQLKSRLRADKEVHLRMESSKVLNDIEGALKSLDTVHVRTQYCTITSAVLQCTDEIIKKANPSTKEANPSKKEANPSKKESNPRTKEVNPSTNINTEMCAAQDQHIQNPLHVTQYYYRFGSEARFHDVTDDVVQAMVRRGRPDIYPWMSGCAFHHDGCLMMVDQRNNLLLTLDEKYNVVRTCQMDDKLRYELSRCNRL